jgi:hypothetical protein
MSIKLYKDKYDFYRLEVDGNIRIEGPRAYVKLQMDSKGYRDLDIAFKELETKEIAHFGIYKSFLFCK